MRLRNLLGPLPDAGASVLITLLCMFFFIGLCLYVYRKERREVYQHLENLPFDEDL